MKLSLNFLDSELQTRSGSFAQSYSVMIALIATGLKVMSILFDNISTAISFFVVSKYRIFLAYVRICTRRAVISL
ncbi:TPA: hypothetical protein DCZ39_01195 [Patescibacteria group bacterium]|nr:hypothetical protein [Candidatus Gracilibacteria bacterium]